MGKKKQGRDGGNCNLSKYNIYIIKMSSGDTLFTHLICTNRKLKFKRDLESLSVFARPGCSQKPLEISALCRIFGFFNKYRFISLQISVYDHFASVCACAPCGPGAQGDLKTVLDPIEPELWVVEWLRATLWVQGTKPGIFFF